MNRSVSVRRICRIGIAAALYAVFSVVLKFPLIGNTYLDLGYVVLTVCCFFCPPIDCAQIGAIGCSIVNIGFSPLGFSPSHFVCNLILGGGCALLFRAMGYVKPQEKTKLSPLSLACCILGVAAICALGIGVKAWIECTLYSIPWPAKLPKAVTAFILDTITILVSVPLGALVSKRMKTFTEVQA